MVESVYFPENGTGYIYDKPEKPGRPSKSDRDFRRILDPVEQEKAYRKALRKYYKDIKTWETVKDSYALPCAKNLIGKTFRFEDGKVNILFGPNASGKSTILKQIKGTALIEESGSPKFIEPLDFGWGEEKNDINVVINKFKKNSSVVKWDGTPVYAYDPDVLRSSRFSEFGAMGDMLFGGNTESEIGYHMYGNSISAGQLSSFMLNNVLKVCTKKNSLENFVSPLVKEINRVNEAWASSYKSEIEYFKTLPKYSVESPYTIIFDEIDKSLDVLHVIFLYTEFFPRVAKEYGCQIILVSHNPLVLSKTIRENEFVNLISVDDEYTKEVSEKLKGIEF